MAGLQAPRAARLFIPAMLAVCVTLLPACAHRNATVADAVSAAPSTGSPYGGFALGEDVGGGAVVLDVIAGPAALAGLLPGDRVEIAAGVESGSGASSRHESCLVSRGAIAIACPSRRARAGVDSRCRRSQPDPVVSLGGLLDAGGDDRYSTGLANGEVRIRHAPGNPAKGRENNGMAIAESP